MLWENHHPIRCLKVANKVWFYAFLYENSNNILQRLILDDDNTLIVDKMNFNGNISQNPRVRDWKHIFKERNVYYFTLSERNRPCELWESKRTRAHIYKHKCMNTHIHTHASTHAQTHIHVHIRPPAKTYTHTIKARKQHTHTHTDIAMRLYLYLVWNV